MEIENLQRKKKPEKRISISIRLLKSHSDFMRAKNISPTKLLVNALEELIKKQSDEENEDSELPSLE